MIFVIAGAVAVGVIGGGLFLESGICDIRLVLRHSRRMAGNV
jgi:hypothetical protein